METGGASILLCRKGLRTSCAYFLLRLHNIGFFTMISLSFFACFIVQKAKFCSKSFTGYGNDAALSCSKGYENYAALSSSGFATMFFLP
jgi:hypothetical protein